MYSYHKASHSDIDNWLQTLKRDKPLLVTEQDKKKKKSIKRVTKPQFKKKYIKWALKIHCLHILL